MPVRTIFTPLMVSADDLQGRRCAAAAEMVSASSDRSLERLCLRLTNATASFLHLEKYVSRPMYEALIQKVYDSSEPFGYESYTVVVGPQGVGKSTLVKQQLNGRSGVLYYSISLADNQESILRKILMTFGEMNEGTSYLDLDSLWPIFLGAADELGGRRITIVLDVDRYATSGSVKYTAKKLARFANVIVIVSAVHSARVFGDDSRQKFIWVDGMTHDEAARYAKKVFPAVADYDLELFFDKVAHLDQSPHLH